MRCLSPTWRTLSFPFLENREPSNSKTRTLEFQPVPIPFFPRKIYRFPDSRPEGTVLFALYHSPVHEKFEFKQNIQILVEAQAQAWFPNLSSNGYLPVRRTGFRIFITYQRLLCRWCQGSFSGGVKAPFPVVKIYVYNTYSIWMRRPVLRFLLVERKFPLLTLSHDHPGSRVFGAFQTFQGCRNPIIAGLSAKKKNCFYPLPRVLKDFHENETNQK